MTIHDPASPLPCRAPLRYAVAAAAMAGLALGCAKSTARLPLPLAAQVEEFVIPWADAFPSDLAVADDGTVWFTDRLTSAIGRFDPADSSFRRFDTPTPKSGPYGLVRGPDGALWYAASMAQRLGRVDPATGSIEEVELPGLSGGPHLLAVHGDRIWFTARHSGMYGSIALPGRTVRVYPATPGIRAYGIAAGRDAVYVAGHDGGRMLRIDPATDSVRLYDLGVPDSAAPRTITAEREGRLVTYRAAPGQGDVRVRRARVRRMAAGPDGRVWLTDFGGGRVLSVSSDGTIAEYHTLGRRAEPYGIAVDGAGRVWYYERGGSEVVVLDPKTDQRARYRVPTAGAIARHIAVDGDRVWLPLSDGGRIGLIRLR